MKKFEHCELIRGISNVANVTNSFTSVVVELWLGEAKQSEQVIICYNVKHFSSFVWDRTHSYDRINGLCKANNYGNNYIATPSIKKILDDCFHSLRHIKMIEVKKKKIPWLQQVILLQYNRSFVTYLFYVSMYPRSSFNSVLPTWIMFLASWKFGGSISFDYLYTLYRTILYVNFDGIYLILGNYQTIFNNFSVSIFVFQILLMSASFLLYCKLFFHMFLIHYLIHFSFFLWFHLLYVYLINHF